MNLDITFCKATRCEIKDTCGRCIDRLDEWVKTMPKDYYIRPISIAEFSDVNGKKQTEPCDMWFEREIR